MARIATTSAIIILLQVSAVLVLALSPATNGLSLDDRLQLKQLSEDNVRN